MAKDSKLLNIGDVLIVNVRPIASGIINLSDYSDVLIGVTMTRTVTKEFRISTDDLFFTDWEELSDDNLFAHNEQVDSEFLIQIRYTRTGIETAGYIEFVSIDFLGFFTPVDFIAPTINSSIFAGIGNSNEVKLLEKNIFKKLYFRGIVPKYITRADDLDKVEDEDYINLFSTIARFFAMIIRFHKRYENFTSDFDLMREHVRQNGIFFDESKITLSELQYLSQHLYDEIRKRGTNMIFKRKGEVLGDNSVVALDGEFVRLLRNKPNDELLYEYMPSEKTGWCVGQSSPMYRGTSQANLLNKTGENTQDFVNLSDFYLSVSGGSSYILKNTGGNKVLSLTALNGVAGLGRLSDEDISEAMIAVDSDLDYEITFSFRILTGNHSTNTFIFGVEGFDSLGNKLYDSFITPNSDQITDEFASLALMNLEHNVWYQVRGEVHAYSTNSVDNVLLNIGVGNNLHFNNKFVKYILPKIQNVASIYLSEVEIWDYKIRPMVRGTNILPLKNGKTNSHSLGFIQSPKLFYVYARNNNNSATQKEIKDNVEKYLLPFNVSNVFVFMSNY